MLATLERGEWIASGQPVVLLGDSGTGKSHLLIGLGMAACQRGLRVRYMTAAALVNELAEAADERTLSRLVARYGRLDLLCLDEFGYVHLDPRGAELLFQVLTEREERASVAVASNAPFSEWGQTFADPRLAAAVVDRLTLSPAGHHRLEGRCTDQLTTSRGWGQFRGSRWGQNGLSFPDGRHPLGERRSFPSSVMVPIRSGCWVTSSQYPREVTPEPSMARASPAGLQPPRVSDPPGAASRSALSRGSSPARDSNSPLVAVSSTTSARNPTRKCLLAGGIVRRAGRRRLSEGMTFVVGNGRDSHQDRRIRAKTAG